MNPNDTNSNPAPSDANAPVSVSQNTNDLSIDKLQLVPAEQRQAAIIAAANPAPVVANPVANSATPATPDPAAPTDQVLPEPKVDQMTGGLIPDQSTQKRLEDLAVVGTALAEYSNGSKFDGNILEAKRSLQAFLNGIEELKLNYSVKLGMQNLVTVLDKMLDDKMKDTFDTSQQNF